MHICLSPQGRQTLRVVPFWMPALTLMAMAALLLVLVLVLVLVLIPLRSAALCFSAAAPLKPGRSIRHEQHACNQLPLHSESVTLNFGRGFACSCYMWQR